MLDDTALLAVVALKKIDAVCVLVQLSTVDRHRLGDRARHLGLCQPTEAVVIVRIRNPLGRDILRSCRVR